ncbi:MAG: ABC transporter permease [Chloroflexota bacterium]|nr:ABC transporter permease [Chloroflexota bacterium]
MSKISLRRKPDTMSIVFVVLAAFILLFIFVPPLKTIASSSPGTLWDTLLSKEVYSSILLTIYAALIATLIGFFLGVPLAYILARHEFWGKRFLEGLIDVPIVMPHSAVGIALLFVFGSNFLMGRFLNDIGIGFVDKVAAIVFAMMFVSVPFLIDSAKEGFKTVDVRLEKVARTLGASPWRSFFRISLPLAWRSIFSGSVLMWARGFSEFGAVYIVAGHVPFFGYHPVAAPVLVTELFESPGGLKAAQPLTVLLILICLIIFIVLRAASYKGEKA